MKAGGQPFPCCVHLPTDSVLSVIIAELAIENLLTVPVVKLTSRWNVWECSFLTLWIWYSALQELLCTTLVPNSAY